MIKCTKCDELKNSQDFAKDKYKKSGLKSCCKKCISIADKKRNSLKPQSILTKINNKKNIELLKKGNKKCTSCGSVKPISEYKKRKDTTTGLRAKCNDCVYEQRKSYRKNNKEEIKINKKEYYIENKKDISIKDKKYRLGNKEKIAIRGKIYHKKNKEKIDEKNKEWRLKNKSRLSATKKLYYFENKEKISIYKREYEKNKILTDPVFKLTKNIRRRILLALEGKDKAESTLNLLGCTIPELRKYLEFQFTHGMNWGNHNFYGWHIDHVQPCASFDLSDPEQQKQCFHYSNLQPLWATDNLKKGSFYKGKSYRVCNG